MKNIFYSKILYTDIVFRLLFLNTLFVIIGYAVGTLQGGTAVTAITMFKSLFLFISLFIVIFKNNFSINRVLNGSTFYTVLFVVFISSLLSKTPFQSFYRASTFIIPFIYVLLTINYLLKYGAFNLIIGVSLIILLVYLIVPLSFLFFGGDLSDNGTIYGYTEGEFFVSNHYGWGSTMVILSSFTVIRFSSINKAFRFFLYIFLPYVFYLLLISANRAGMLSLFIAFTLFILIDKTVVITQKVVLILIPVIILLLISLQENSVIDFLRNKNQIQLETGNEGRLLVTNLMLNYFNENPIKWFTGVGMFDYNILNLNGGVLGAYHNSYWDILFGSGIIIFILFLSFMIFRPLRTFFKKTFNYSLLIIPLMIIPFFEGNLTAGQFLFFPWFSYMILLNAKEFYINKRMN